jgi:uncharacterized membrane protein YcaP (DUF421 family)
MLIIKTVLTAAASIAVMFALTKIMGNKQISQLNLFDYINGITIGSIAAEMALADEWEELWQATIAMTVYGLTGFLISMATMHSMTARKIFSGEPLILIENGTVYCENVKKAKLDLNDLLIAARCDGIYSVTDIALAVMESNGRISFCQTERSRPVNLADLGQSPAEKPAPLNLIIDGILMEKNMRNADFSVRQLSDALHAQGYSSPDEIFLAVLIDGEITFYPKNSDKPKFDYYS